MTLHQTRSRKQLRIHQQLTLRYVAGVIHNFLMFTTPCTYLQVNVHKDCMKHYVNVLGKISAVLGKIPASLMHTQLTKDLDKE